MPGRATFAIVGASLAGGRAAEELRRAGFDGRVVLIGEEKHAPYERPPLSKEVLKGSMSTDDLLLKTSEDWAKDDVELLLGRRVAQVRISEGSLEFADGTHLRADKVLLTTGGRARPLDVPGAQLDGVHYMRTLEDSLALKRHLVPGARIVVIGAGFIGAEVAASAKQAGCEVTLLEVAAIPLERTLGATIGTQYGEYHRERGVDLRTGVVVERLDGEDKVNQVVLADGTHIETDCVVVGIGIVPNDELAADAGLRTGNGIHVDEFGQTSHECVFSAGDVANYPNAVIGQRVRLEHWQNAQNQAINAARTMLGIREPFDEVPWFWSDQFELNLQMAGHPRADDSVVMRGDVATGNFCALYVRDGALAAALAVNRPRDVRAALRLIESKACVDVDRLADESFDLRKIARS